jgi:fructose-bisphosphate aldolase class II
MMAEAESGQYAVGYFECWNLESLMAVADAAEALRAPVLVGFSGIYLPDPERLVREHLSAYAALGLDICRNLSVPANLVFNESPYLNCVLKAIDLGFGLVMFSDEKLRPAEQLEYVRQVVGAAHQAGVAVEGEAMALPGVAGELTNAPADFRMTDTQAACAFVEQTGIDAFAVNVGQAHLHGRREVRLDFDRLADLRQAVRVPLVLHGASSVSRAELTEAIRRGIRKINFGSVLKRTYFDATLKACAQVKKGYNPYKVVGSGLADDILVAGRLALQKTVEDLIRLLGSADRA